jgi:hypothetical protein
MAYDTANPPALAAQRVGADGGAIFIYKDGDSLATVTGINYVTNATDLGMIAGDRIIHIDSANGTTNDLTAVTGATTGTASGALCSAIEPIGETSIALQSAGTGTILIGDIGNFLGDPTDYRITTGDTDISDGGTLVITPALVKATAVGTRFTIKSDVLNLSEGLSGAKVISGSGATRTLTKAESGSTVLMDSAAGQVFTLPATFPGMEFTFLVTVDLTAAAYAFVTDGAFLVGSIEGAVEGAATGEVHFANGTTHVGVSMNKTTTGGLIGGSMTVSGLSSTLCKIEGTQSCTATPAPPYTT